MPYICIDLKSYYASVECVARGLDPLRANLLVADESRTDKTICLAVSPALKAMGVPSRPRLFEAKTAIARYESLHRTRVEYVTARPRMQEYIRISSRIVEIYLRHVAPEDLHVYSIDECFMDVTPYLHLYTAPPGQSPAHVMAMEMIHEVLKETGITATAGIGSNLYLAKVAMDIVAKKSPPDRDGVRIAELDEISYRRLLWDHVPLTDFWQVGYGTQSRLMPYGILTMGDLARFSLSNSPFLYKKLGVNAEILIDHAWGLESCTMQDIHGYKGQSHSLSTGQVLSAATPVPEARVIFLEMADNLCADLVAHDLTTRSLQYYVSFDPLSLEVCHYSGPVALDFYQRLHPRHAGGRVHLLSRTSSAQVIIQKLAQDFDRKVDPRLLVRRLGIAAMDTQRDETAGQLDFFTDYEAQEREKKIQQAVLEIRQKYGPNMILKGINYLECGTARERNLQIGGHRG